MSKLIYRLVYRLRQLVATLKTSGIRYTAKKIRQKLVLKIQRSLKISALFESHIEAKSFDNLYDIWLRKNYPRKSDLQKMSESIDIFPYKPMISIIMPVFNCPEKFLREAIESVIEQIYPHWQLCIADDASSQNHIEAILKEYSEKDSRIKVVFRQENGHISRASNSALELATGEFVALLDHDDLLTPDALYEVALLLNRYPLVDMVYSDEDKVLEDGSLIEPYFKPDWCPDSLLSRMYTCHLGVYRRSLVDLIGGFRIGYEGGQDYDLVLRLTEKTEHIFHIPKILYHWRMHPGSTAQDLTSKSYATDVAKRAILDALNRRNELGKVVPVAHGHHIVRYEIIEVKLVSIIIPTRNLGKVLDKCLLSIFSKTTYPNYEVIVIDNGSDELETLEILDIWKAKEPKRFQCEVLNIPFNYSKINNYAANCANGDYLLFLNNDTEVITNDWIEAMVEQAQRVSIGAIGALLLYPDNTIQHAGVINVGRVAGHGHKHCSAHAHGYFNQLKTVNNYSSVTAACLMCRKKVFQEVGGFDESLAVAFNDIDLCFKIFTKGYRNVYLPHVKLYHCESKSRGFDDTPEKMSRFEIEIELMQAKWKNLLKHDPCYSKNLTKQAEDFGINLS